MPKRRKLKSLKHTQQFRYKKNCLTLLLGLVCINPLKEQVLKSLTELQKIVQWFVITLNSLQNITNLSQNSITIYAKRFANSAVSNKTPALWQQKIKTQSRRLALFWE